MNAFNLSSKNLEYLWQELRDNADYDFKSTENQRNRLAQLVNTALASDPKRYASADAIVSLIESITSNIFGGD
jgi:hypothetical protein